MTTTGSGYAKYQMTVTTRQPTQAVDEGEGDEEPEARCASASPARPRTGAPRRRFGLLFLFISVNTTEVVSTVAVIIMPSA